MADFVDKTPKVSIIIPMYNAKKMLPETMESVFFQTYVNWEVIIVDDCSTDNSYEYALNLSNKDQRIKVYRLDENSGPGAATKYGFEKATGELIAFIDSDDLWMPTKLECQIKFMIDNNYEFTCTSYEQIDKYGDAIGRVISCKNKADYKTVLKTCPIGSSTVIITSNLLSKVEIPVIRKNNDYSLWLRILKIYPYVYGMQEILMKYRVWPESISYNKVKKVKYFWKVFREYEGLSFFYSFILLVEWTFIKLTKIK